MGAVVIVRPAPSTAAGLHPHLREDYRDLYRSAVEFVSSSLARHVEISWRCRAVVEELALHAEPWTEEDYDARCGAVEGIVLAGITRIDPPALSRGVTSIWSEIVWDTAGRTVGQTERFPAVWAASLASRYTGTARRRVAGRIRHASQKRGLAFSWSIGSVLLR
ncbi:hypothetical protein [Streptomyces sp. NPDC049881]|uniref:hypothetical protein n=1 Tax=Streptomyces sp. NPDC049881 TaxID=3155778 RepID=UPI0034179C19